jgi:hypothetical protein
MLAELEAKGLTEEILVEEGWYCSYDSTELAFLLNAAWREGRVWQAPVHLMSGGLVIPFVGLDEQNDFCRVRPFEPRTIRGRIAKYESPKGSINHAYFPKRCRPRLRDTKDDIHITEGERKCLLLALMGHVSIGLTGIYSFLTKGQVIPDLLAVPWEGRRVYIVFDYESKAKTARAVRQAAKKLTRELLKLGAKEVLFVTIPAPPAGEKNGIDDYLAPLKDRAGAAYLELLAAAKPADSRTEVILGNDEARVNAECEKHLTDVENLYQRGSNLVQIHSHEPSKKDVVRREVATPVIRTMPAPILREKLTELVNCVRLTKNGSQDAPLPAHVVSAIHARGEGEWKGIPVLEGVVSHPTFLADGTLLSESGYHADSGLFVSLPASLRLDVPEAPNQEQARAAAQAILDVYADFPFQSDVDRAAFLAAHLTPLCRYAFDGPAPWFVAEANRHAAGKGKLINGIFLTVTGRTASTATCSQDTIEMRKVFTAVALQGDEMVLFDNLSDTVGNDTINRALTTCRWQDRILGINKNYDGPLLTIWYGTGNNPIWHVETRRRVLRIYLESHLEHPENRSDFKCPDLHGYILNHRSELLSAALTVLKAYFVAGKPKQALNAWGSFEGWSELVRAAVVYAGLPDPYLGSGSPTAVADDEDIAFAALLRGLAALDVKRRRMGTGFTAKELCDPTLAYDTNDDVKAIVEAVEILAPLRSGEQNRSKPLGSKLHHLVNRVAGDYILRCKGKSNKGRLWVAQKLESSTSASDSSDSSDGSMPNQKSVDEAAPESEPSYTDCKKENRLTAGGEGVTTVTTVTGGILERAMREAFPDGTPPGFWSDLVSRPSTLNWSQPYDE